MRKAKFGSVYLIRCAVNGKVYIGLTRGYVSNRWHQHKKAAALGHSSALYQAMRKHGADQFSVEHLASAIAQDSLGELERELIRQHGAIGGAGYNMSLGGESAIDRRLTEEGRARVRAARNTPEALRSNRERNTARMQTPEGVAHQARMVEAARLAGDRLAAGRRRYAGTEAGRAQIVAAAKVGAARKAELSGKAVNVAGQVFRSVADAAAAHEIERGAVRYRIKSARFADWTWQ